MNLEASLRKKGEISTWENIAGSKQSLEILHLARNMQKSITVFTKDAQTASQIAKEILFFQREQKTNIAVLALADWETLPYDRFSPHQDIIAQRLSALYKLLTTPNYILLMPITTAMHRLPPSKYILQNTLLLHQNENIDLLALRDQLISNGYGMVNQVMEHGEFAIRGSILDIFPTGSKTPYRIDFFGNEVDSIRVFDIETQRSTTIIESIEFLPAKEFSLSQSAIKQFQQKWSQIFSDHDLQKCALYQNTIQGHSSAGIEYYLTLFFPESQTIFDYLSKESVLVHINDTYKAAEAFWHEIKDRYEQLRYDRSYPILPPKEIFLLVDELFGKFKFFYQVQITAPTDQDINNLALDYKQKNPLINLQNFLQKNQAKRILFCADSRGRQDALLNLFKNINLAPQNVSSWNQFINSSIPMGITTGSIREALCQDNIILIPESSLYAEQMHNTASEETTEPSCISSDALIRNLTELQIGDPIVHIDYGIGRYIGLQTISIEDLEAEYLTLEYAKDTKLYVPITSLHLISRYLGANPEQLAYTELGTKQWEKAKDKAITAIHDVAAELLDIYARRATETGHAFVLSVESYQTFAMQFPFELTSDQQKAVDDIINDMTSTQPMDRLICGDVGFGKTEVAMRAAFIATQANKQVAILVPTTILAQQHYDSFKDRFADWPIKIALLSRFTASEHKTIGEELSNGKIDIVIATHKLLQEQIKFHNLGLLIVDEEHRFGVKQKERLKALKANLDILTLTATPIPRTLNMAMTNIRDLSVIATPPKKRLAVKTFVREYSKQLIREAVLREILRGGQVYFLHNDINSIKSLAEQLATLIPEARITIAHGQMPKRQLSQIMRDFYHGRFNLFICTTIIESGIDVPTANTIIIHHADRFGLAQLHQLRGRVGRSHHQAYAYLLVNSIQGLTKDAAKRLDAIAQMDTLGAGFVLAMHDLEIRGAGEILGEQQSGQIQAIGFNLYMEFLDETVKALKSGRQPEYKQPYIFSDIILGIPALLPNDYIGDVHTRLTFYKRISNATSSQQLRDLQIELIDRFGLLPNAAKNLFAITELKLRIQPLGIKKIKANMQQGYIEFSEQPTIDPMHIIKLIQTQPTIYKLLGPNKLKFVLSPPLKDIPSYLYAIESIIDKLT